MPAADVSVRLVLVVEIVEVSDREQEKTLFAKKYRFLEWQKVTAASVHEKNADFSKIS